MSRRTRGWSAVAVVAAVVVWTAGQPWGLGSALGESKKQPQPKTQSAKSDQERMVGNWCITSDDSLRKGEMWVIDEDRILMHAKHGGAIADVRRPAPGNPPR
jgi:hypothetical protein